MIRLSESAILDRVARAVHIPRGSIVRTGIGDDCAIIRPRGTTEDLLFTTDLLLENVHFRRDTHSAVDVGHKALARGLSDIAAMGGVPRFCLLSLAVAGWTTPRWIDGFYKGLLRLAARHQMPLAGGDLARAELVACDIVVCGAVPRGKALLRSGARPGDLVYVSGHLGGAALGLWHGSGSGWKCHLRPEPRVELGQMLRKSLHATAAMDLSDGLSLDLWRLCERSGVGAEIDDVPVFTGASLELALHGGEDYELLFTVRPRQVVPAAFEGIPLTRIGRVVVHRGRERVRFRGEPLAPAGYDHFNTGAANVIR
ncbi:MAG: thiamine-phosphate kinase [Bryobacteraceae bacterium]